MHAPVNLIGCIVLQTKCLPQRKGKPQDRQRMEYPHMGPMGWPKIKSTRGPFMLHSLQPDWARPSACRLCMHMVTLKQEVPAMPERLLVKARSPSKGVYLVTTTDCVYLVQIA